MIQFRCRGCGQDVVVDDSHEGQHAQCEGCGSLLRVPPRKRVALEGILIGSGSKLETLPRAGPEPPSDSQAEGKNPSVDNPEENTHLGEVWSPHWAFAWSILFTPSLGPVLLALNWSRFRQSTLGLFSFATAIGTLFLLPANAIVAAWMFMTPARNHRNPQLTLGLSESDRWRLIIMFIGAGLLWRWYQASVEQARLLQQTLRVRLGAPGLAIPLAAGTLLFGLCFAANAIVFAMLNPPNEQELAAELRPAIVQELKKSPDTFHATIENLSLTQKSTREFEGSLEVRVGDRLLRYRVQAQTRLFDFQFTMQPIAR